MRAVAIMLWAAALTACAVDPSVRQQARLDCQSVGISQSDPYYAACEQAYTSQRLETRLERAYRDAQRRVPTDVESACPTRTSTSGALRRICASCY